jgi:hypothetical protein
MFISKGMLGSSQGFLFCASIGNAPKKIASVAEKNVLGMATPL